MIDWQWIYWPAQLITLVSLGWVGSSAVSYYVNTSDDADTADGRFLLRVLIAIILLFLLKDLFWTMIIYRSWLPLGLRDPLSLAIILAFIQLGISGIIIWFWRRIS